MCTVSETVKLHALLMHYLQETQTRSRCRVLARTGDGVGVGGAGASVTWKLLHDKGNYCNSNRVEAYLSVWSVMMQELGKWVGDFPGNGVALLLDAQLAVTSVGHDASYIVD
jgi:hypothetical protein